MRRTRWSSCRDEVILLSAPRDTILKRIARRPDNPFGKDPDELRRILDDLEHVEPQLRAVADHEIVTTLPVEAVVASILNLVGEEAG